MNKKRWLLLFLIVTCLGAAYLRWWTMPTLWITDEQVFQIKAGATETDISDLFGGPPNVGSLKLDGKWPMYSFSLVDGRDVQFFGTTKAWITDRELVVVGFDDAGKAGSVSYGVNNETLLEKVRRFLHLD